MDRIKAVALTAALAVGTEQIVAGHHDKVKLHNHREEFEMETLAYDANVPVITSTASFSGPTITPQFTPPK
jgi:hypothetical protein